MLLPVGGCIVVVPLDLDDVEHRVGGRERPYRAVDLGAVEYSAAVRQLGGAVTATGGLRRVVGCDAEQALVRHGMDNGVALRGLEETAVKKVDEDM